MPGLNLFTSNRLEILVSELAAVLRSPLGHPLKKEVIVVQSRGMERWICLELARKNGICANMDFPFPGRFTAEAFYALVPEAPRQEAAYEPGRMTWDIMRLLPPLLAEGPFESLRRYLGDGDADVRLLQLASRIATTFDHYLVYRPDLLLGWEAGKESHWQALLWRALAGSKDARHPAALLDAFLRIIRSGKADRTALPERVSVFGISALPPFHIHVLAALAGLMDVNLFLMNPCMEYWGDVLSKREATRLATRHGGATASTEDLHMAGGNSLLSSMGTQGRDFFELIHAYGELIETPIFFEPGEDTLLTAIQSDILNLRERDASGRTLIDPSDRSVQIHSCHSPMREMEVLQDRLLAFFDADPTLKPSDILVMMPDIGTYAPIIQAVFSLPKDDARHIPFSIADRGLRQESVTTDHFLKLLDFPDSRFGASQVFEFLEAACVRDRFLLSEEDLEVIRTWIDETGIRWGIDAEARAAMDLPAAGRNTWREGLDRMLLGYALPERGDGELFAGILPFGGMEGADTVLFERFLAFIEQLFATAATLKKRRTLGAWSETLGKCLDTFFAADDANARDILAIRECLNDLAELETSGCYANEMGLDAVKVWLGDRLEKTGLGHGFLSGGVTFCSILPMRSIPFKVVCLAGMDDGAYPRQSPTLGFDLMAKHPRQGDRSRRQDDRYLFLEALLSARHTLSISYLGQAIDDNAVRPPSVLVSELLDAIEEGFSCEDGREIRETLVTRHPLQAFNAAYFSAASPLASYSEENCRAARQAAADRTEPAPFIVSGLPEAEETWKEVDLDDLCRFFSNPSRYLLTRRLSIRLEDESPLIEDSEPFVLEGLERYGIRQELAAKALADKDLRDLLPVLDASGRLPHGTPGQYAYNTACRSATDFADRLRPFVEGGPASPLDVDLTVGPFHLTGRFDTIYPHGSVLYRLARAKAKDYLRGWIRHIVLCCVTPRASILVFEDQQCRFRPVEDAKSLLEPLLSNYFAGLSRPLKFFPESSWTYARQAGGGQDAAKALRAARTAWSGFRPEADDAAFRLCFGHTDPLDEEFSALSLQIFGPLLEHLEDLP